MYAVNNLGYATYTWNYPGTASIEEWSYHDLYEEELEGVHGLGIDADMWDCHINHYIGYWWEDIEHFGYDQYLTVLGWDVSSWDDGASLPETEDMYWDELTSGQQAAAAQLCYTRELWNGVPITRW